MQIVNIQRSLDNFYIYTLLEVKILITKWKTLGKRDVDVQYFKRALKCHFRQ